MNNLNKHRPLAINALFALLIGLVLAAFGGEAAAGVGGHHAGVGGHHCGYAGAAFPAGALPLEAHGHAGHGPDTHGEHGGSHGSATCSFGCSVSMLGAGHDDLQRPPARLGFPGLNDRSVAGVAFRPTERPPRILL